MNSCERAGKIGLFFYDSLVTLFTTKLKVKKVFYQMSYIGVGSLGVIIKSYNENIISFSQAENYIMNLYEISSIFVTKTIVELVIEELRKVKKGGK